MKRGISCERFVRFEKNYTQKISRVLAFFIAAGKEFFQISDGTRKRRVVDPLGSLGWTSVQARGLRESEGRRDGEREPAGDCLPQGAPIVRRRPPLVRARPVRQAVGMGGQASFAKTCLPVDPPSSLRSAADRTGFGRLLGAGCGRKVRLGLAPERSGAVVGAPPGGRVEGSRTSIGLSGSCKGAGPAYGVGDSPESARRRRVGIESPAVFSYRSRPGSERRRERPTGARCEGSSAPSHPTPLLLSEHA